MWRIRPDYSLLDFALGRFFVLFADSVKADFTAVGIETLNEMSPIGHLE